jgi:hypothetical protein
MAKLKGRRLDWYESGPRKKGRGRGRLIKPMEFGSGSESPAASGGSEKLAF